MKNFLKHNLEMPLTGGSTGGSVKTVVDNEAVGDMKATARNDVNATNYLEIDRVNDVVYDKANEPELWEVMKEYVQNDVIVNPDSEGEFFQERQNSLNFGSLQVMVTSCYLFNGKWIRTLDYRGLVNGKRHTLFQVADDFSFSSYREYPVVNDDAFSNVRAMCYIPELNKIIISGASDMRVLNITDADDLINYADTDYGGSGNSPIIMNTPYSSYLRKISLSADPSDPECLLCITDTNYDVYVNDIANIDTFFSTATHITEQDLINDGYNPFSSSPIYYFIFSGRNLYFYDDTLKQVLKKNVDDFTYTIDKDLSGNPPTSVFPASSSGFDGSISIKTDVGNFILNRENSETTLKTETNINPNISSFNQHTYVMIPKANVLISQLSDTTGLTGDLDEKKWWVSFDDGQNWEIMFSEADQRGINWQIESSCNQVGGSGSRIFSTYDLVINFRENVFQTATGIGNVDDQFRLVKIQEEGFSDLFTVQSLNLNDDIKGFLRRKP